MRGHVERRGPGRGDARAALSTRVRPVLAALLCAGAALVLSTGVGVFAVDAASPPARPPGNEHAVDVVITPDAARRLATIAGAASAPGRAVPPPAASPTTSGAPPTSTAQTVVPPTTAAPAAVAPAVPGQEATVDIPSLGIALPVVEGGQAVIDEGVVAHYDGPGWRAPVAAGAAGTYWLAAHHVTHGAPFERLPSIRVGAQVVVVTPGHSFTYTVTFLQVVGTTATYATVYGTQPTARLILLQTCLGTTERLLVHGVLAAAT
jgi:LPXTG-site transpeptidase (sortase) family protein